MTNAPIVCCRLDRQAVAGRRAQWVCLIVFRFDAVYRQESAASPWAAVALWRAWQAVNRKRRAMAAVGWWPCVTWDDNRETARRQVEEFAAKVMAAADPTEPIR